MERGITLLLKDQPATSDQTKVVQQRLGCNAFFKLSLYTKVLNVETLKVVRINGFLNLKFFFKYFKILNLNLVLTIKLR